MHNTKSRDLIQAPRLITRRLDNLTNYFLLGQFPDRKERNNMEGTLGRNMKGARFLNKHLTNHKYQLWFHPDTENVEMLGDNFWSQL